MLHVGVVEKGHKLHSEAVPSLCLLPDELDGAPTISETREKWMPPILKRRKVGPIAQDFPALAPGLAAVMEDQVSQTPDQASASDIEEIRTFSPTLPPGPAAVIDVVEDQASESLETPDQASAADIGVEGNSTLFADELNSTTEVEGNNTARISELNFSMLNEAMDECSDCIQLDNFNLVFSIWSTVLIKK